MRLTESKLKQLVLETIAEEKRASNRNWSKLIESTCETVLEEEEEEAQEECAMTESDELDESDEDEEMQEECGTMTEGLDMGRWKNLAGIL